jgi:hypothetical protein
MALIKPIRLLTGLEQEAAITDTLLISGVTGNTTASATLTLSSTSNATKGQLLIGTSIYDEVNNRLGIGITPLSRLHLSAGSATANTAPLQFVSGPVETTARTGIMEYNGTNLLFVRTGTTRETVFTGNAGTTAPSTTIQLLLLSNIYGIAQALLATPNSWASVNINGTNYKIPLYT